MDDVVSGSTATTIEGGTVISYLSRDVQKILKNEYMEQVCCRTSRISRKIQRMIYFLIKNN